MFWPVTLHRRAVDGAVRRILEPFVFFPVTLNLRAVDGAAAY